MPANERDRQRRVKRFSSSPATPIAACRPAVPQAILGTSVFLLVAFSALVAGGQPTDTQGSQTTESATAVDEPSTTEAPTTTSPPETSEAPTTTVADDTTPDPAAPAVTEAPAATATTAEDPQARQERERAVANLNLAKAADVEIAAQLNQINEQANLTLNKIDNARKRMDAAQLIAERSSQDLEDSAKKQQEIEASLALKAVEGFKTRSIEGSGDLLGQSGVNRSIRQNQLLDQASLSTTELLEELRGLLEDRRLASDAAERAAKDARTAEQELEAQLETLKAQQSEQLALKVEAERRIDQWAGELTAYAKEDAAIQQLIGQNAAPAVVSTGIATPTTPSALGFQWPLADPRVTSEYGYRIHPVYGTRRLHAGIDLGAGAGVPISTSNDGVVIFAGTRGGYGRTVIVDHGGGITTLYAHMSEYGASEGQLVNRGDIVGFVGSSGTATGNHLHFEVRVNGGPANPRNYLP